MSCDSGRVLRRFARCVRYAGLAAALACGAPTVEAGSLAGFAQPGCGPTDGPAVEIHLVLELPDAPDLQVWLDSLAVVPMVRDSALAIATPDFVRVLLWDSPERLRGRRLDLAGDARHGDIQRCDLRAGCVRVPGSVTIDSWDGAELTGRLEEPSPAGAEVRTFRARWIERTMLCG